MRKILLLALLAVGLAACTDATRDLEEPVAPLGDFKLGFSEVVAPNLKKLLISETISQEDWSKSVDDAVERRFGRFDGARTYHFGISVEEYSIPIQAPLVPGRSAVGVRVTVWDDAKAAKLNEETEIITVIKVFEAKLFTTKEQKVQALSDEIAAKIEAWLRVQQVEAGWFGGPSAEASAATVETDAAVTETAEVAVDG